MNCAKTLTAVSLLTDVYGRPAPSSSTVQLWRTMLEPYTLAQVQDAIKAYQRSERRAYAPVPGDIAVIIDGERADHSADAWALLQRAIRTVGSYSAPAFADPAIHRAIADAGGWSVVCQWTEAEMHFHRQRWTADYARHAKRPASDPVPRLTTAYDHAETVHIGGAQAGAMVVRNA
jgi:hypothetical protein